MNIPLSKHPRLRILCLIVLFAAGIFAVHYHSHNLSFHSRWTETDKQQITEIAEALEKIPTAGYWKLSDGWSDYLIHPFKYGLDWDDITHFFDIKKTEFRNIHDTSSLSSAFLSTVYRTAKSGDASYVGDYHVTLLQLACAHKKVELALHLIESGADLDACLLYETDDPSLTQRHTALSRLIGSWESLPDEQRLALFDALISHGANANVEYQEDNIVLPIVHACTFLISKNPHVIIQKLIDAGADAKTPFSSNGSLISPLAYPIVMGLPDVVRIICKEGVNPNDSYDHNPPLSFSQNIETARILLEYGADVNVKIEDDPSSPFSGYTPLFQLCRLLTDRNIADAKDFLSLYFEHGADPNKNTNGGITPLMILCERMIYSPNDGTEEALPVHIENSWEALVEVSRILIDHGADPSLKDNEGKTALDRLEKADPEFRKTILEKLPELDTGRNKASAPENSPANNLPQGQ